MIPFRVDLRSGVPVHEQVAFAAKKAILSGRFKPGQPFPSVRTLSKAVKIHANTAQRVITVLQQEGLLEARPGVGTIVVHRSASGQAERARVLAADIEHLTVEALRVGLDLEELLNMITRQWRKLQPAELQEK